ncbi:MAG: 4-hydroxy-tetrahydrodipicolinate reductase [Candidatus Eisenbacteria bacterium]|uniref:4-hydroxy-tetrahydrodipicolinate reductase n=1 Tax=Eiseniibacteriota bacterium TaxID=2212470 RepID=A0A849ST12_UNCEI|nr:4-hydroxy-tetrahydrodipicolinate reductase [Candidatus Eisenbacteria bacterium]
MISLVVVGASGRMGRAVLEAALEDGSIEVAAAVSRSDPGLGVKWESSLEAAIRPGRVVIEFSTPEVAGEVARRCGAQAVPLVSGTTALTSEYEALISATARSSAVLRSANFSLGLLALRRALETALRALPEWDVEIVERHHRGKADSPSGTALRLAADVAALRGWDERAFRHGREGRVGTRHDAEIGLHAVRGGSWVGDHSVLIAGAGEALELRHTVQDRSAFAHGALRAAKFVAHAPAGLYTLEAIPVAAGGA